MKIKESYKLQVFPKIIRIRNNILLAFTTKEIDPETGKYINYLSEIDVCDCVACKSCTDSFGKEFWIDIDCNLKVGEYLNTKTGNTQTVLLYKVEDAVEYWCKQAEIGNYLAKNILFYLSGGIS
ncbi:hypothetical protein [Mastigocoleus testarum]|uniref:Uncharacterized protein n=1 Tax=Mastigocoleus testarum BC008 TaxID=371196 RepID=A0A0V7ZZV0_9CYAN|nr:hypothetical protein [Mastigocoleus testarum]KST69887.1 hypothetical protein BC008_05485 [Mastigocoleus testarum BC008]